MKNNSQTNVLNRREVVKQALAAAVTVAYLPLVDTQATSSELQLSEWEAEYFVENDYPFFGGELPEGY